jgi:hypothetical protein
MRELLVLLIFGASLVGCTKASKTTSAALSGSISVPVVHESDSLIPVTVALSQTQTTDASFDLLVLDETAKAGVDYQVLSVPHIVIAAGSQSVTIPIPLLNDKVLRPNKNLKISVMSPSGFAIAENSIDVTILNDNLNPEVYLDAASLAIPITSSQASVMVRLSAPAPERYSIPYSVSGTAIFGTDHFFASGNVTFGIGDTVAIIQSSILQAANSFSNKTVVITLLPSGGVALGKIQSETLVIAPAIADNTAVLDGAPTGLSNTRALSVGVTGPSVTSYIYKIVSGTNCGGNAGYSIPASIATRIADSVLPFPDGTISLCVLGVSALNVSQEFTKPTVVTWQKSSLPPNQPSLVAIESGNNPVSASTVISNVGTPLLKLSGLFPSYTVVLFDSADCTLPSEIGSSVANGLTDTISGAILDDGDHSLSVQQVDQYGVSSACKTVVPTYRLDRIAPKVLSVKITAPDGLYSAGVNFPIVVTFSKPLLLTNSTAAAPFITMDTSPIQGVANYVSADGATISFNYHASIGQNSPLLDYSSQATLITSGYLIRDQAGNLADLTLPAVGAVGSISRASKIFLDTTSPSGITHFYDGQWALKTLSPIFTWVASSDAGGSGISAYQVAIGSIPGSSDVLPWTNTQGLSFQAQLALTPNATCFGSIRVVDQAGNISTVTEGDGFIVDAQPPTTPVVTLSSARTFDITVSPTVSWTLSKDDVSGFDHYEIALGTTPGGKDISDWKNVGSEQSYQFSYAGSYGTTYYPTVRSLDRAGNISTSNSPSWLAVRPNLTPFPAVKFAASVDAEINSVIKSEKFTIAGLDLPVSISVDSTAGNAKVIINDLLPVSTAFVNNGDVIQLVMTSAPFAGDQRFATIHFPNADATWSLTTWACPTNYLYIPTSASNAGNFCISKYQIHFSGSSGAEVGVSSPNLAPTLSDQSAAVRSCSNIGTGYALISNNQWQTVARNIEGVPTNWSGGIVGSGSLSGGAINTRVFGNTPPVPSPDDNVACAGSAIPCNQTTWGKYRRTMTLSTGQVIWDMTGLAWQWVSDVKTAQDFVDSSTYYCPDGASAKCFYNIANLIRPLLKLNYGSLGDYSGSVSYNQNPGEDWGGIGEIVDTHPITSAAPTSNVLIKRGGALGDADQGFWHGGIYSVELTPQPYLYFPPTYQSRPLYYVPIPGDPASATLTSPGSSFYGQNVVTNAGGGYGTKWTGGYAILSDTQASGGPDYATSLCASDATCIAQYGFGVNCTVDPGEPHQVHVGGENDTFTFSVYYNVWNVTCLAPSAVPAFTLGDTNGSPRCVYTRP